MRGPLYELNRHQTRRISTEKRVDEVCDIRKHGDQKQPAKTFGRRREG
jgi:hypothetical protein